MEKESDFTLMEIESYLLNSLRSNGDLNIQDLPPAYLIRKITEELVKNTFFWVGNDTYAPNRLIIFLPIHNTDKLLKLQSILTSISFHDLMKKYIASCGYKLFGAFTVFVSQCEDQKEESIKIKLEFRSTD